MSVAAKDYHDLSRENLGTAEIVTTDTNNPPKGEVAAPTPGELKTVTHATRLLSIGYTTSTKKEGRGRR